MGRKRFPEPVHLGVKPCVCLGDPDRASGHLRASVPVEERYHPSFPTFRANCGSRTTVCGCPASEKPGGTRHRKCLASSRLCGCSLNASPRRELPMDLENFHLEEGAGLASPTSLPQSSGTQAERGDPSESLPGLLGAEGGGSDGAQSVLTDDTSSKPLPPSTAPLTPSAAAGCPSCC